MSDKVELIIGGERIEQFESYRIECDLFEAADSFSLTLANPDVNVTPGQTCKLYVGGVLELTGLIDRRIRGYDQRSRTLTVSGRDLMGLLVDSYCTDHPDYRNKKLSVLAAELLENVPFINRKDIIYGAGSKARAVTLEAEEEEYEYANITPGATVFEVLKKYALARGRLFFALPDGTFVFGEPVTSGKARFFLTCRKDGAGNIITSAEETDDISRRYSRITVIGQKQNQDAWDDSDANFSVSLDDDTFPAFNKPFVVELTDDGQAPGNYARVLLDEQKFAGYQLRYTVPGHGQAGSNYAVNAVYHVHDEVLGIRRDMLCYGRTFERDRTKGTTTTLKLSRLGVLPA